MVQVSEHAMKRYRDRIADLDDDLVKRKIRHMVQEGQLISVTPDGKYYFRAWDGLLVVQDNVVLTVLWKRR